MATIWRFPFTYSDVRQDGSVILGMPEDAEVLCVQMQGNIPAVWAKVDPSLAPLERRFFIVGTGRTFPEGASEYIGTWQDNDYVWHLFEGDL